MGVLGTPVKDAHHAFTRTLTSTSQLTARRRIEAALKMEGFFVLTEIDVQAMIKSRLQLELQPYILLGVVKPSLVHQLIMTDPAGGLMAPHTISITQDEAGDAVLSILDPAALLASYQDPQRFTSPIDEARLRLQRALAYA